MRCYVRCCECDLLTMAYEFEFPPSRPFHASLGILLMGLYKEPSLWNLLPCTALRPPVDRQSHSLPATKPLALPSVSDAVHQTCAIMLCTSAPPFGPSSLSLSTSLVWTTVPCFSDMATVRRFGVGVSNIPPVRTALCLCSLSLVLLSDTHE